MGEIESERNRVLKKENKSMNEVIQSPSRGKASSLSVPWGYQGRGSKSLISHVEKCHGGSCDKKRKTALNGKERKKEKRIIFPMKPSREKRPRETSVQEVTPPLVATTQQAEVDVLYQSHPSILPTILLLLHECILPPIVWDVWRDVLLLFLRCEQCLKHTGQTLVTLSENSGCQRHLRPLCEKCCSLRTECVICESRKDLLAYDEKTTEISYLCSRWIGLPLLLTRQDVILRTSLREIHFPYPLTTLSLQSILDISGSPYPNLVVFSGVVESGREVTSSVVRCLPRALGSLSLQVLSGHGGQNRAQISWSWDDSLENQNEVIREIGERFQCNLRHLSLTWALRDESMTPLARLKELRHLMLRNSWLMEAPFLQHLTLLEEVDFGGSEFLLPEALRYLGLLPNLTCISLQGCTSMTRDALQLLRGLKSLRDLDVSYAGDLGRVNPRTIESEYCFSMTVNVISRSYRDMAFLERFDFC